MQEGLPHCLLVLLLILVGTATMPHVTAAAPGEEVARPAQPPAAPASAVRPGGAATSPSKAAAGPRRATTRRRKAAARPGGAATGRGEAAAPPAQVSSRAVEASLRAAPATSSPGGVAVSAAPATSSPGGVAVSVGPSAGAPGKVTSRPAPEAGATEVGGVRAARTTAEIQIDGDLDEPAWDAAPPFDGFVELYPREGGTPRRRTEVRILYDDDRLYVAFRCEGEDPSSVARPLGRRDRIPPGSDSVVVAIDPSHGRRTAYLFAVSAGGVLEDRLVYDDTEETSDWDAVWDAAVAMSPSGWTAELSIPFAALRFTARSAPVFGIYLERKVGHTHEVLASTLIPLGAGAFVSRFSDLALGTIGHVRRLELVPFLAARVVSRPAAGNGAPGSLVKDPSGDVGLDFAMPLTSRLALVGAVNPDFGQVEADPVVLNLSRFEPFFPEKRPFFLRDLDLFAPLGGASGDVPQQLVYTRRVGLDAPILGAAKISGEVAPGVEVGLFDAYVTAVSRGADDRALRFHLRQPLHLAPESAYPAVAPNSQNFFAGALRLGSARTSFVGLQAAIAHPAASECTASAGGFASSSVSCLGQGGAGAAALFALRSADARYGVVGQVTGSRSLGPPSNVLPDGTVLNPGDLGWGTYLTAGKLGGEPIRATISYELATPRLDLNATGFQPDQNEQTIRPEIRFVRRSGLGPLHDISVGVSATLERSADGRNLDLGRSVQADARAVLPGFHEIACSAGYDAGRQDLREIVEAGIPYERPPELDAKCSFQSDRSRPVALEIGGAVTRVIAVPPLPGSVGWRARAGLFLRPHPRVETILTSEVEDAELPGRFVEQGDPDLLFANLSALTVSVKLRQQFVFTPRLTLEAYLQLFAAYERFGPYYSARPNGSAPVLIRDLRPSGGPETLPDLTEAAIRANVVLRWENRPGSAVYVVYSRDNDNTAVPLAGEATRLRLGLLGSGPSTDTLLIKWSFALSR